jgi:RHS repeat-associated protein
LTPEGYYNPVTANYYYYLKDHLGNNRVTYHYSGTVPVIDQEVEYYPFGSMFAANNLQNNLYLYNGKELNNEFFENYDFGARFYDPQIGRWYVHDPLADNTPSVYTVDGYGDLGYHALHFPGKLFMTIGHDGGIYGYVGKYNSKGIPEYRNTQINHITNYEQAKRTGLIAILKYNVNVLNQLVKSIK